MAPGVLNAAKAIWEVRSILHRLELSLRVREMCSNTFPVLGIALPDLEILPDLPNKAIC